MNAAKPDSTATERIIRRTEARRIAQGWIDIMKREQQSSCVFSLTLPQTESTSLAMGIIDEELREAGYIIGSHSHFVIGKDQQGNTALNVSFLVRTIDGSVKRVTVLA